MLEDYYTDPNKTTSAEVSKLFTRLLYNERLYPTYWDYATFVTGATGKFSQFIGVYYSAQMYVPSASWDEDRWESFYSGRGGESGILSQYREMEKNYANLPAAQQELNYIFLQYAKVVLYDQTAQMVDLWGDIPFTQANSLNATSTVVNPAFDDAAMLYDSIINGLDLLNTYFASKTLSSIEQQSLAKQDILLKGNITLWRKYTNSLRLRLLMRLSNYDNTIQSKITAMLNDPGAYPLVDNNDENILLNVNPAGGKNFSSEGLRAGLTDAASSSGPYAPAYMLETMMVANNDPRTDVFWDRGKTTEWIGMPLYNTPTPQETLVSSGVVATYDSATFIYNWNVPGVILTAAEISFLKAEAYERWSFGDAQTAYETGIKQSIEFYYSINQNQYRNPEVTFSRNAMSSPSPTEINNYIGGANIVYSGTSDEKLKKIWSQKWVNFFILQAGQAWAEIRRTGYPELPYNSAITALTPDRLIYPSSESFYNAPNYAAVAAKDTYYTHIFWDVD
jgi:hypothetical protein